MNRSVLLFSIPAKVSVTGWEPGPGILQVAAHSDFPPSGLILFLKSLVGKQFFLFFVINLTKVLLYRKQIKHEISEGRIS